MAWKKKRSFKKRFTPRKSFGKSKKRSGGLKKTILGVLNSRIETKLITTSVVAQPVRSVQSAAFIAGTAVQPLGLQPGSLVLLQGLGDSQRVGNKARTVSATIKGNFQVNTYNAINNTVPSPVLVKMWIFYDKTAPNSVPSPYTDFFQNGTSSAPFANNPSDLWRPVNTDKYRVLGRKIFKLGYSNYGTAVPNTYSNNDFSLTKMFTVNLTKLLRKQNIFNDNTSQPSGRNLYMMFCPCQADGIGIYDVNIPVNVSYMQSLKYKDA